MEVRLEGGDDWLLRNLFMEVNSEHQDDDAYAYGFSYTAQEEYNTHKLDPGCNSCTDQYFVKDVVTITRYGRMHFD